MSATALVLLGLLLSEGGRAAQPETINNEQQPARVSPAELFDLAEKANLAGDFAFTERALLALAENPEVSIRNEARFRLAVVYRQAGRYRDAAVLLRRILDEQPEALRVRLELAATLEKIGDRSAALRELRALRSGNLSPGFARFVDRIMAGLQASKPIGFHIEVAIAPDTNINRATRSDTLDTVIGDFDIGEASRERSGVGGAVRTMVSGRLPITDEVQLTGQISGEANIYRNDEFNDVSLELGVGPEFALGKFRFNLEIAAGQLWYGMEPYQHSFRLAAGMVRPVDAVSQVRFDGGLRWTDNQLNDLQDGRGLTGRIRYERALSPRLLLSASAGADRFWAKDDAYSTRSWNLGLTAYREAGRMTLITGVEFGQLKADERLILLPKKRQDRIARVQAGAVFRQITFKGFAPIVRLVHERNRSSVAFYDYARTRGEIGLSRAF